MTTIRASFPLLAILGAVICASAPAGAQEKVTERTFKLAAGAK